LRALIGGRQDVSAVNPFEQFAKYFAVATISREHDLIGTHIKAAVGPHKATVPDIWPHAASNGLERTNEIASSLESWINFSGLLPYDMCAAAALKQCRTRR
jgi:hypothetical protein